MTWRMINRWLNVEISWNEVNAYHITGIYHESFNFANFFADFEVRIVFARTCSLCDFSLRILTEKPPLIFMC